jgi:aspartokinase
MRKSLNIKNSVFQTVEDGLDMISTSKIKISVVIDLAKGGQALKAVHAAFIG